MSKYKAVNINMIIEMRIMFTRANVKIKLPRNTSVIRYSNPTANNRKPHQGKICVSYIISRMKQIYSCSIVMYL